MKTLLFIIFLIVSGCDLIQNETWEIKCDYSYKFDDGIVIKNNYDICYWIQDNIEYYETVYVQTPEEIKLSGKGDCKAKVIMNAYLLYTKLNIDSEIIFCLDRGYEHLIMKYNGHYYNGGHTAKIDDLIGIQYIIKDSLYYCEAMYEILEHHRLYSN